MPMSFIRPAALAAALFLSGVTPEVNVTAPVVLPAASAPR